MIPNSLVQLDGLVDILSDGSVIGRVLVKDLLPTIEMMMIMMVMVMVMVTVMVMSYLPSRGRGSVHSSSHSASSSPSSRWVMSSPTWSRNLARGKVFAHLITIIFQTYLAAIRPAVIFSMPEASEPLHTKIFLPESRTKTSPWFIDDQAIGTF